MSFKLGDEIGSADEILIRITREEPLWAVIVAASEFWLSRPGNRVQVGQTLIFDRGSIVSPVDFPWFVLATRDGKPYFEHYR